MIGGKNKSDHPKDICFFITGLAYILARVSLNFIAVITPLFLIHVAKFSTESKNTNTTPVVIATVPLFGLVCSVLYSTVVHK